MYMNVLMHDYLINFSVCLSSTRFIPSSIYLIVTYAHYIATQMFDISYRSSGKLSLPLNVPDSITSWLTSAFATNEKTGFGLAEVKPKVCTFHTINLIPYITDLHAYTYRYRSVHIRRTSVILFTAIFPDPWM